MREAGAEWITNPEVADFAATTNPRHDFRLRFELAKADSARSALRHWPGHRGRVGERKASPGSAAATTMETDAVEDLCSEGRDHGTPAADKICWRSKQFAI